MLDTHDNHRISFGHLRILLVCYFSTAIALTLWAFLNMRDYNDEWILDGMVPLFVVFVFLYSITVGFSANLKTITIATVIFLVVINAIPNLKYSFIYGTYDPLGHYGTAAEIVRLGHIPSIGIYALDYGSAPNLQIFLSTTSIVTSFDVGTAMKIFLTIFPLILPVMAYFVIRRLSVPESLSRLTVIATAFVSPTTYFFTGTRAIYFLYVFLTYFLVLFFMHQQNQRRQLVVTIIFGFAVMFSHELTSFYLLMFFPLALFVFGFLRKGRSSILFIVFWAAAYFAHFLFASEVLFANIVRLFPRFIPFLGGERSVTTYYEGFFRLGLLDEARILTVELGRDIMAGLLSVLSIPIVLRRLRGGQRRFYYILFLFAVLPVLGFLLSSGGIIVKYRFWYYFAPLSPFLVGMTLWYAIHRKRRFHISPRIMTTTLVCALICISILQTYPCQPLVPKVLTAYGERYAKNYQIYTGLIQRSLVTFVDAHNHQLPMSTTAAIHWQIFGLTEPSFQALLSERTIESDLNRTKTQYQQPHLILISSIRLYYGQLAPELEAFLLRTLESESIVYANGEAYCFFVP